MRPPQCCICGADHRHAPDEDRQLRFTYITFRSTDPAPPDDGWTGHPDNIEWFCDRHVELTAGRTDMSLHAAFVLINTELQRWEQAKWHLSRLDALARRNAGLHRAPAPADPSPRRPWWPRRRTSRRS